ncbi:MAG TPA: hypothetical protein VGF53_00330 [Pseudolabrys sp.]
MRAVVAVIAIALLAAPAHAQWGRSGKARKQQQDTQKSGDASKLPPTTVPCKAFTKNERGNWYVKGPVTFNIGTAENKTLQNLEIPPKFFIIGGVDLYEAIQKQCGV